jgi:hypothetical protein
MGLKAEIPESASVSGVSRMLWGVPISLVVAYALFRMFEYYSLKEVRERYQSLRFPSQLIVRNPLTAYYAFSFVLLPARVFGWGLLLFYGWRAGWLQPVKLIVMAFPLSLLFQALYVSVMGFMTPARGPWITLAAVPITAAIILALMLQT